MKKINLLEGIIKNLFLIKKIGSTNFWKTNLICDIMKKCKKCLLPETHETINFDSEGTWYICNQYSDKKKKLIEISKEELKNLFLNTKVNMSMIV